jgi:hypothetical protein
LSINECRDLLDEAYEVYSKLEMENHMGFCLTLQAKALRKLGKDHLYDAKEKIEKSREVLG